MEKYIITALIVWIIISTVLLLFVIVSVSKNKTKQEREVGRQRAGRVCEFFEKNKLIYSTAEKSAVFF